jgi:elongation factor G
MKVYEGNDLRNVGLVGHLHCGKTALTAAMLFASGGTTRLTRPDEGNTITDFDDEEIARKMTISTAVAPVEWQKKKINVLDTPGFSIFSNEVKASLIAADAAISVVDATGGVEVQTEKTWEFLTELKLPRAILINKLDRERSSFDRALESVREAFGRQAVPVQLPIGNEKEFQGIIDLIRMRAYCYKNDADGKGKETDIPSNLTEIAAAAHEALVEAVAEGNDALMEEFFAEGTLPVEHIVSGLRAAFLDNRMHPVLCASAAHNVGTDLLLNFITEFFPSPVERGNAYGMHDGKQVIRKMEDGQPVSAFIFKTMADPFAGRVSLFRVVSGVLKNDTCLPNATTGNEEKLAHLGVPKGKSIDPVLELHAGDIGAVAKLRDTLTGHTLYEKGAPVAYPPVQLAEPSIAYAIHAKTRNDEDRMGQAIHRIMEEDLSIRFDRDPQTKDFLLHGCGQQHIEVVVSRMKRRYQVDVALSAPKIPYRETIRGQANVQGRHKKQTGGHGQFGDCWIRMEPLERGAGFQFANEVFGGSIPKNYIPAVEKGIIEASSNGFLAGYPMVDFKVTVYDGSYHDVDSSELAFKLAARKAFKAAMQTAKPSLLEPVMRVEVQAPVEYAGDLMGDLNGRRGRISGMDTKGSTQVVRAIVPMSEMLTYQNDLTSMTQGRATFSMEFDHYDYVPGPQADKIAAAAKAARTGVEEEED